MSTLIDKEIKTPFSPHSLSVAPSPSHHHHSYYHRHRHRLRGGKRSSRANEPPRRIIRTWIFQVRACAHTHIRVSRRNPTSIVYADAPTSRRLFVHHACLPLLTHMYSLELKIGTRDSFSISERIKIDL